MSEYIEFDDETQRLIDLGLESLRQSRMAMEDAWVLAARTVGT